MAYTINRRDVLKGIVALVGSSLLPNLGRSDIITLPDGTKVAVDRKEDLQGDSINNRQQTEVDFVTGTAQYDGLEIVCDGETAMYRHAGERRTSNVPYVSLGTRENSYTLTTGVPHGRSLSIKFLKGNKFGDIDSRFGELILSLRDYASAQVICQNPRVPLIKTVGQFDLVAFDTFKIDARKLDDSRLSIGVIYCGGNRKKCSPAFQLMAFTKDTDSVEEARVFFADNHGRVYKTNMAKLGIAPHCVLTLPHLDSDFDGNPHTRFESLYSQTKSFAALEDKERFWNTTPYRTQVDLFQRNAH